MGYSNETGELNLSKFTLGWLGLGKRRSYSPQYGGFWERMDVYISLRAKDNIWSTSGACACLIFSPKVCFIFSHYSRIKSGCSLGMRLFFFFSFLLSGEIFSCGFIIASFCHMTESVLSFKCVLLDWFSALKMGFESWLDKDFTNSLWAWQTADFRCLQFPACCILLSVEKTWAHMRRRF